MQTTKAAKLRDRWGDKPCDHPGWDREYYLGASTGDDICTSCGRVVDFDDDHKPIPSK